MLSAVETLTAYCQHTNRSSSLLSSMVLKCRRRWLLGILRLFPSLSFPFLLLPSPHDHNQIYSLCAPQPHPHFRGSVPGRGSHSLCMSISIVLTGVSSPVSPANTSSRNSPICGDRQLCKATTGQTLLTRPRYFVRAALVPPAIMLFDREDRKLQDSSQHVA